MGNANREIERNRLRVAQEAARIMAVEGIRDFRAAKLKALDRLSLNNDTALPRNSEVNAALREYQRLFQSESQPASLVAKRASALKAMELFAKFSPRLVGPILEGTADSASVIEIQVFSDTPEEVEWFLEDRQIPVEMRSARIQINRSTWLDAPLVGFYAAGEAIEALVLPMDFLRQAPIGSFDAKPMKRASLTVLRALLDNP